MRIEAHTVPAAVADIAVVHIAEAPHIEEVAVGRVVAFDENLLPKLKKSAEEIYFTLIANGNLDKITEVMALCSVIIIYARIDKELGDENIAALNGVSYEEIEKIIILIENK